MRWPLAHLPWALRLTFSGAPAEATIMFSSVLIERLGPPAVLFYLQRVVDAVAGKAGEAVLTTSLVWLVGVMLLTEATQTIMAVVGDRFWYKMNPAVQDRVLQKAISLSLAQYDDAVTHDLIERVTQNQGMRLGDYCWRTMHLVATAIGGLSTLALLAAGSPWLAALGVVGALPVTIVGIRQGKRLHALEARQSPGRRLTQYLGNLLSRREAATELRAYQLVPFFLERWRTSFVRRRADHLDVRWAGLKEGWASNLISGSLLAAALVTVLYLASRGAVGAGQVVVLIGGVRLLQESLTAIAVSTGALWDHGLTIGDLRRFLELPVPGRAQPDAGLPFPVPLNGPIRFQNLSFRYPGATENVLDGVSFEIMPGEKVALVGANGAGKSTLIKLMLGLYTPLGGRITYGSTDLQQIAPQSLQAGVSCVFQDFVRYDFTLEQNIAMGRLEASTEAVERAGSVAGLTELARSLPEGYQTQLGKTFGGAELSGGQWQRIALARAFVRGAEVLVLDEPTAALDPRAELEIFGKFLELVEGKTAILISHRLGSTRLADRVVVLDGGRVAESGSHYQLMAAGGLYATLFKTQAQWYENDPAAGARAEVV